MIESQKVITLECQHTFCSECIMRMIEVDIKSFAFNKISCPQSDCRQKLSDKFIVSKLKKEASNDLLKSYRKLRSDNEIINNSTKLPCVKPGCNNILKVDNKHKKQTRVCSKCRTSFCGACRQIDHENSICSADSESNFKQFKNNYMIANCPACKIPVEKESGCNHMTCGICGYQFCWICRGKYSSNHYTMGNYLFGCPGMQNTPIASIKTVRKKNFYKGTFFIIGVILITLLLWRYWNFFYILLKVILALATGGIWAIVWNRSQSKYLGIPITVAVFWLGYYILVGLLGLLVTSASGWFVYKGLIVTIEFCKARKSGQRVKLF